MKVTSVKIIFAPESAGKVKAIANIVLNNSLVLKGIRLMQGQYGFFLSFPTSSPQSIHKVYDTRSNLLRKEMQTKIVKEYENAVMAIAPAAAIG